ncbi:MAG: hypothetical protein ACRDY5_06775, partial [Acidimicrobiales bacterium]
HGDDVIDLLFASSGIEPEIASAAEPIEVLPPHVPAVATVGPPSRSLVAVAAEVDFESARRAVGLSRDRGVQPGRDLRVALDALVRSGGKTPRKRG